MPPFSFLQNVGRSLGSNARKSLSSSLMQNSSSTVQNSTVVNTAGKASVNSSTSLQQYRSYHESVMDHFNKPRNVGKLDSKSKNVGTALVGKASCGDVIKLQIEVDPKTGNVINSKFKTFGCGSAIASSSLATEKLIGKPLSYAENLKNTDISKELNLPPVKIHCSVLAEEAIQEAIADYRRKQEGSGDSEAKKD